MPPISYVMVEAPYSHSRHAGVLGGASYNHTFMCVNGYTNNDLSIEDSCFATYCAVTFSRPQNGLNGRYGKRCILMAGTEHVRTLH